MLPANATLQQTRSYLERELRITCSEGEASAIARLILEHAGYPTAMLLREPTCRPGSEILTQIKEIVAEFHTGRPIQYILGYTYFMDLKIAVDEHVLIPRPETEEMVFHILEHQLSPPAVVIDLGTGSGCMALALKQSYPEAAVFGVDFFPAALRMAEMNARRHRLEVTWIREDFNGDPVQIPGHADLLVSNPPYVRESERSRMADNVLEHEPPEALFVQDSDPLIHYRSIARLGLLLLNPGGSVWVEINESLGAETAELFLEQGYQELIIIRDIHDKERFIHAVRPEQ